MKKNNFFILFLFLGILNSKAQSTPEQLCDKFAAAFFQNDTTLLKSICSPDEKMRKETLSQLNDIYIQGMNEEKISWNLITTVTSGAMLKGEKGKPAKGANVVITFSNNDATYKINIWNCHVIEGVWKLGNKISLKKE